MITRAVILAAGRLPGQNGTDTLKTLTLVEGKPLLHWNLEKLVELGVRDISIVVGYRGDEIRTAADQVAKNGQLGAATVRVIENPDWRLTSGISLLAARAQLTERAFCILGDRMIHREDLRSIASLPAEGAECVMLVDTDLEACADLRQATKARLAGGKRPRVVDVGSDLSDYQAYDCGHSLVSPEIVGVLERLKHPTIADALKALALRGLVSAHEVRDRDWRRIGGFAAPAFDHRTVMAHVDGLLEPKEGRYVLLNPGPVNTTARVKSALVHHDVCHRDSDYSEVLVALQRKLRRIFRATPDHSICVITGSGTAAMECAIASCVPSDRKILVIDNGAFGERLSDIAKLHEMDLVHLRYEWGQEVQVADVRRLLDQHPDVAVVAMCHHETAVGLLNPIREIGALCRERDALLLVDAVSSLGAEDLDVVRDNVDVCWSSANKCLHGISGVGFVCVAPRVWTKIADVKPRVFYLDLKRYRKYLDELAQTPFTPAVATYFALDAACDEYLEDGWQKRQAMYEHRNRRMREGLAKVGLGFFTNTGRESHTVMTVRLPDYATFGELYEDLKDAGFIIYDCKSPLKGTHFQIANMGDLPDATIDAFLDAFGAALGRARGRRAKMSSPPAPRAEAR